jgi:hypothetical protein
MTKLVLERAKHGGTQVSAARVRPLAALPVRAYRAYG